MKQTIAVLFIILASTSAYAADVLVDGHWAEPDKILLEPDGVIGAGWIRNIESYGFVFDKLADKAGVRFADKRAAAQKSAQSASSVRFLSVRIPRGMDIRQALSKARSISGVKAAWPNYRHKLLDFTPNDPYFAGNQGNFKQVLFPYAWDYSFGSGVTVAVIDTGYRSDLDDAATLVSPYDFWGGDEDVQDFIGHGTLVANVIGEASNNGIGCASIAPSAKIMPLKVFPDWDEGALDEDIAVAIDWARNEGANVINMSLGGGGYSGLSAGAVNDAHDAGLVIFAATGNDGTADVNYPAAYENVIAVGSSSPHSPGDYPARSSFSNFGDGLDLVAPGEAIVQETWSSSSGIGYYSSWGTSVASPHAAGLAALLISFAPENATPEAIEQTMTETAHTDKSGWDDQIGWGEIDAKAAIQSIIDTIPNEPPIAKIVATPASGSAPLTVTLSAEGSYDPDNGIVSYFWSLPDMVTHSGAEIEFTFEEAGSYSVLLTVKDQYGASGTDTATIEVSRSGRDSSGDEKDSGCGCSIAKNDEPDMTAGFILLGMMISALVLIRKK